MILLFSYLLVYFGKSRSVWVSSQFGKYVLTERGDWLQTVFIKFAFCLMLLLSAGLFSRSLSSRFKSPLFIHVPVDFVLCSTVMCRWDQWAPEPALYIYIICAVEFLQNIIVKWVTDCHIISDSFQQVLWLMSAEWHSCHTIFRGMI